MNNPCEISIDGVSFLAETGANLVEAAKAQGIFIPSLCYHPTSSPPLGTCRTCICKIDGKYRSACTERVHPGLNVELNTPELLDIRKGVLEMMLAEGNHFCPACEKSGDCDLQHMGYELGIASSRFPHLFKDQLIDFRPKRMVMEHNRCIKCRRCVEEVWTDEGKRVFMFLHRGNETIVGIDYEAEAKLTEAQALAAMKICPTGAIMVRGKSFPKPFGNRLFDNQSVQKDYHREPIAPIAGGANEKKRVATVSLAGCFGCHMSMLDIDTGILDMAELVSFDKSPLTDIKKFSGRCDIGLIEGGCCNTDNVEVLKTFREMCDVLVVVGECAIWGGVPAMRNMIPLGECLREAYLTSLTSEEGETVVPYHEELPKMLDRVYGCHEVVKVDYVIPGCPPSAEHIWKVVKSILFGVPFSLLYSEFKYD
ncbi:MAG: 2Fe-2S iron-sulfur cluster-binding protein [Saprospiraceae bacterium]|nr:2Fe-2S iron-sulfur cluster-binding protein [Saprospiraceae bacterium]